MAFYVIKFASIPVLILEAEDENSLPTSMGLAEEGEGWEIAESLLPSVRKLVLNKRIPIRLISRHLALDPGVEQVESIGDVNAQR